MKTKLALIKRVALLVLLSTLNPQLSTWAQGTAFTYQGQLNDGASPGNGSYDLTFSVFAAASGGSPLAGPLTNSATAVSNGLFTVTLDFGAGMFTGPDRFLEISVRTNGNGAFTTLSPRQKLTPAPYAIYSTGAANAGIASGVAPGSVTGAGIAPATITAGNIAGGQVLKSLNGFSDAVTMVPGSNIAISAGGNSLVISTASAWNLTGNSGTSPTNGNFLGTTDNQPLEFKAGGLRALRLEPDSNNFGAPNVIGGSPANLVDPGIYGATIGGGGVLNYTTNGYEPGVGSNHVSAIWGTIGGGRRNTVAGDHSTIGGGHDNFIGAAAYDSVIGGGEFNAISNSQSQSVIAGGYGNRAIGSGAAMGGGLYNTVGGNNATVSGGYQNTIQTNSYYTTIAGGIGNSIGSPYATVGGGGYNSVGTNSNSGTISGGYSHTIKDNSYDGAIGGGSFHVIGTNSYYSTIAGGRANSVGDNATSASIAGGFQNAVQNGAGYAAIGGGYSDTVLGSYAAVPGGYSNTASGNYSFAAGLAAQANHNGAFVWSDASDLLGFSSTAPNQFSVRALGGVRFVTSGAGMTLDGQAVATANTLTTFALLAGGNAFTGQQTVTGGNVGIGITNPAASLHIHNDTATPLERLRFSGFGIYNGSGVGDPNGVGLVLGVNEPNNRQLWITDSSRATPSSTNVTVRVYPWNGGGIGILDAIGTDAATPKNLALQVGGGNVGIGTTNPTNKLQVSGTVQATAFQGDGSGLINVNSGALANYVFAYNTGTESVAAANTFQDITFNTDAQINGWTHTPGTAPYTSAQSGLYLIQYDAGASTTIATGASISVHASLNLTEIPGSQAAVFLSTNSVQVSSISRSFIASVNASDVLTLQVAGSSTGSRLIGSGLGATRPSVSLTITRIQ